MKRFLAAMLMCAMLLFAAAMAEQPILVSCAYSIYGGMENEDFTCTIRLDDSPEMALLTLAKRDGFEAYSLPREALDDLTAYDDTLQPLYDAVVSAADQMNEVLDKLDR